MVTVELSSKASEVKFLKPQHLRAGEWAEAWEIEVSLDCRTPYHIKQNRKRG